MQCSVVNSNPRGGPMADGAPKAVKEDPYSVPRARSRAIKRMQRDKSSETTRDLD